MFCNRCGAKNPDEVVSCLVCGQPQTQIPSSSVASDTQRSYEESELEANPGRDSAQESCPRHSAMYTWWPENAAASDIVDAAIRAEPTIACTSEHNLVLQREKIQVVKLAFDPESEA